MASYLFPYQQQNIQPYQSPLQTYSAALQVKNDRLNKTLSNIRSRYDSLLNTPLTNEENQLVLRNGIDKAMSTLSGMAVNDVTIPENQAQINTAFDSVLDDQDLIYDMAWTRKYQSEIKKAEDIQKRNPELVPPQNLDPLYRAQEEFRAAPKGGRPKPVSFSPYYDYNSKVNTDLDKIKADVDRVFSVATNQVEGPDGKMHSVSNPLQYTVKQLKDYKVKQLAWSRINTDAQALNQMSLDYNYNTRYGMYPPQSALTGIDTELSTYQTISTSITQALNSGVNFDNKVLTQNDRDIYTSRQKTVEGEISRLQDLKNQIKLDPNKSKDWFTFNKYIKDYVDGKAAQYAYKEDSLISSVPGLDELTKYQLDVWKEQWKTKLDINKDAAKDKATKFDDASIVRAPYNEILTQLSSTPGGISLTNAQFSALGQMTVDTKGRLNMDWSGNNTNPDNTLIFTPAQGSFDKKQMAAVDGNIILSRMNRELESLKVPNPSYDAETEALGATEGGPSLGITNQYADGETILENYSKNPTAAGPKVKEVIEKYKTIMSRYGVDPTNVDQRTKLEASLNDPTIEQAVKAGTTISLNGRFQFVPDQGTNLIQGDNGKMYMKGKFIVPQHKLAETINKTNYDDVSDIISKWELIQTPNEETSQASKANEQTYGVSVYVPVNGEITKINDRLLDVENFQDQWGVKAPQMREISRQRVLGFQDVVNRSRSLTGFSDLPYSRDPSGNYIPLAGPEMAWGTGFDKTTAEQRKSQDNVNKIIQEISTRTGQGYGQVATAVNNIFGSNTDALSRQIALDNYISNLQSSSAGSNPGFRSFGTYEEGRAALENQLNLYKTGKTKNNVSPSSTLLEAMSVYAPASDGNNPLVYAQTIARNLGITINTPISQIDIKKWADAIEIVEGNKVGNNPGNLRPVK